MYFTCLPCMRPSSCFQHVFFWHCAPLHLKLVVVFLSLSLTSACLLHMHCDNLLLMVDLERAIRLISVQVLPERWNDMPSKSSDVSIMDWANG